MRPAICPLKPHFWIGRVLAGRLPDIREQAKNVTSRVPAVDRAADQKNLITGHVLPFLALSDARFFQGQLLVIL